MSLGSMTLIKRSFGPGHQVKGDWVEGPATDTPFQGTAQPASGQVIQMLPEGKRNIEAILVFAPIELEFTTAEPRLQRSADIIIWQGREYEVQTVRKWDAGIYPHWELAATRKQEGSA